MTEAEIEAEIVAVSTAITNMLKTGKAYELRDGSTSRRYEGFDLDKLRDYRYQLQLDLAAAQDDSGVQVGF